MFAVAHKLLKNPVNLDLDLDLGPVRLRSGNGSNRRYDKFDAMRDEENRRRTEEWWNKKSEGEKRLWVGGGVAAATLLIYTIAQAQAKKR
jgi:hypothetical protein